MFGLNLQSVMSVQVLAHNRGNETNLVVDCMMPANSVQMEGTLDSDELIRQGRKNFQYYMLIILHFKQAWRDMA
jgi:hypothetical protein